MQRQDFLCVHVFVLRSAETQAANHIAHLQVNKVLLTPVSLHVTPIGCDLTRSEESNKKQKRDQQVLLTTRLLSFWPFHLFIFIYLFIWW